MRGSATKPTRYGGSGALGSTSILRVFSVEESSCCRAVDENVSWLGARHGGYLQIRRIDPWSDPAAVVEFEVLSLPTLVLTIGEHEMARLAGTCSERMMARRLEPVLNGFILGSACRDTCPLQDPNWVRTEERTALPV